MKNAIFLTFLTLSLLAIFGFAGPYLISSAHTELVVTGVAALLFGLFFLITKVKDKLNENQ